MSALKEITTDDDMRAHVASLHKSALLVIYFHAPWAKPCATMTEVLKTLSAEYPITDPPSTSWVSLNADSHQLEETLTLYDVSAVPYIILQRDSTVIQKIRSGDVKEVRLAIEKHAKGTSTTATTASNGTGTDNPATKVPDTTMEVDTETDPEAAKKELTSKLDTLVSAADVMLFMKGKPKEPQCGFSRKIVGLLRENCPSGFGFFDILADDEVRQGLKEYGDWPTYPQLWIGGELVGGLDIVKEMLDDNPDALKELADEAAKKRASKSTNGTQGIQT
ncbi:glutaredoxin [Xylariomycetidae sp. FL2044]|nr:glutaredoxin [Xylariomycetidae sp. FL2044]